MSHPLAPPDTNELLPVIGEQTAGIMAMLRVFVVRGETVLISGPTGSGKSRLARWCHHESPRADQPFEVLDLLGVPDSLQMAELVGWRRGAFTGASQSTPGALARAKQGTLFIDEIDKLSLEAQAGLLRVLEDRRYRPLGDGAEHEQQTDAQFIIGTNVDLHASVRAGRFREDLYYRINVLPIHLPPLSDRVDEIPAWTRFMLARCSGAAAELAADACEVLCKQPWPGNLRQLDNVTRRAFVFALAERPAGEGPLALAARHVERSLAFEADRPSIDISEQLRGAAEAVAGALVRRRREVTPVAWELLDGFRGMVLESVVRLVDSREQAFRLFGREHLLKGRNHHRALKLELERAQELVELLDCAGSG